MNEDNSDGFTLVQFVNLSARHRATGATTHYVGGSRVAGIKRLEIMSYQKGVCFYLIYKDADGVEMTDTYHETIEQAKVQAYREFEVRDCDWTCIGE